VKYGNVGTREMPFCDCYCGDAYDPDCDKQEWRYVNQTLGLTCNGEQTNTDARAYCTMQFGDAQCRSVSANWKCSPNFFNELKTKSVGREKPYCDCACGDWDDDCYTDLRASEGLSSFGLLCNTAGQESLEIREFCNRNNILKNLQNPAKSFPVCSKAPPSWFCSGVSYNEFDSLSYDPELGITCDCGCGAYDLDCSQTSNTRNFLKCSMDGSRMMNVLNTYFTCPNTCPFCQLTGKYSKP
jgi:hypothetical protein